MLSTTKINKASIANCYKKSFNKIQTVVQLGKIKKNKKMTQWQAKDVPKF